jgi:RNA polymerase sigma-70 factor (ECF subfamily)
VRLEPIEEGEAQALPTELGAVFAEHALPMYRVLLAYTGGRGAIAEEAVGEAFARAAARKGSVRDPVRWLYRVAFNVANDELRRERRGDLRVPIGVNDPPEYSGVFDALAQLPRRERAVMIMFYVVDLPIAEVADRLGLSRSTVRVHLTRGRRRMAMLMGDETGVGR